MEGEKRMKINHPHLFMTDLHMWSVHTAYLIRFTQNLEIGACALLGECVPEKVLEMSKRAQMFRVDTDNVRDNKSCIR